MPFPLFRPLHDWNLARLQGRRQREAERNGESLDYAQWVRLHDTLDDARRAQLRERAGRLARRPLISVLMPVFDPDLVRLDDAIASVRAQLYDQWELCIADDRSTDPRIHEVLLRHAASDPRIRIAWREHTGHVSDASNTALDLARGEYIALLDHDDRLPEHALLCVAETLAHFPYAEIVYSDEDKLDAQGRRCEPYFKCDWNLELFRGQNLIAHLGVYRTGLVRAVGGFRRGYEGAQDYDLALRCIEEVVPTQIVHIPHVLYHWRIRAETQPNAVRAGRRALRDHFARSGVRCDIDPGFAGGYRCDYRLPRPAPTVAIVVVDSDSRRRLHACVEALHRDTDYPAFDVAIAYARDGVTLPDACNLLIAQTRADLVALVDSRCRPRSRDWLLHLAARACLEGAGAVGAKLLSPRGRIAGNAQLLGARGTYAPLGAGLRAHRGGHGGRAGLAQHVGALGDGCIVVRPAHIQHVGWLDPSFRDMGAALVDLTYRFSAYGQRNHGTPFVEADLAPHGRHHARIAAEEAERVATRWGFGTRRDAHYNDNLGLAGRFRLALSPRVSLAEPWFESIAT